MYLRFNSSLVGSGSTYAYHAGDLVDYRGFEAEGKRLVERNIAIELLGDDEAIARQMLEHRLRGGRTFSHADSMAQYARFNQYQADLEREQTANWAAAGQGYFAGKPS